jgi:hypothetical protein
MTKAETLLDNEMWKDTPPVEVLAIHAKEFAEWAAVNGWFFLKYADGWGKMFDYKILTTSELYQIFNENK